MSRAKAEEDWRSAEGGICGLAIAPWAAVAEAWIAAYCC